MGLDYLLSNAIQHGDPNSVIKVSICGFADEVVYQVANEGNVIPTAKLRTLFDPVKRFAIRPANERAIAGTENLGLGLYVVKQIVAAHEGRVSVTSSEKDGVVFAVRLPRITPNRRSND